MPRLQTLRIFKNEKLLSFPEQMFDSNNSLRVLDLTHNERVTELRKTLFVVLQQLKELNIGSNNFQKIPKDLLSNNCDKLTKLIIKEDLYQCQSSCNRTLPAELVKTCKNLEDFQYSFHRPNMENVLNIPSNIFEFQTSTLRTIMIDNANLPKDKLFDLFFNGSRFKKSLLNLNEVSVRGNNIRCMEVFCDAYNNGDCDCDLVSKIGQVARRIHRNHSKYSNFKLTCNKNENVIAEDVLSIYLPHCERIDLKTIIFYVGGIAIFLLSVVMTLCAKERILIWLYNHPCFSKLFEIKVTETTCVCEVHPSHRNCRFECFCRDAFISYSKDDENFALLLRENLEDTGSLGNENPSHKQMAGRSFSCLDHQRDWKAGIPIAVNIR